ncbi:MAG: NADH-quinone oxidoreductase subunit C [Deltaproteobacteria bacterium]|nr:NADH-quinone oxidoreductase subunit C [Deltaproteobacteria bacterium]
MITDIIKQKFLGAVLESSASYGDETVVIDRARLIQVMNFLKTFHETPFNLLLDVCGVDYLGKEPRFEVVYHLYSLSKKARLRVKVKLSESDLSVPSVMGIWEAADWFEREAYDMFGIRFEGHPKLKRLLMWEEFKGHPLRKDYPMNKRQPLPEPAEII